MTTASNLKKLSLRGVDLGYSVHGRESTLPPLVFVHGGFLRSTEGPYDDLIDLLAHHHRVYALDLRGHGASASALEGWTLDGLADDVVTFSQALHLDRPAYVGHSLSAFIGLLAEIRHPVTFSALCLLAPGPADPRNDPVQALEFLIAHGRDREMLREAFGAMFVRPPGRMLERMLDAITLIDPSVFSALREQNLHTSINDQLQEVAPPTLFICGACDTVVPLAIQRDMARKVPRSKEVVFLAEGHLLPNESADMVAREILGFLKHDV